jgi:H+/Cl- antiporter ClcA
MICGCAIGVVVAFKSPINDVLFAFEKVTS